MKQTTNLPSEKILGGRWGSLVGDALGVPVEFCPLCSHLVTHVLTAPSK